MIDLESPHVLSSPALSEIPTTTSSRTEQKHIPTLPLSLTHSSSTGQQKTISTLSLSVEEAALLALENNLDLRIQRYEPIVAGTFESLERGIFDPELFAEGTYGGERASEVARSTGERFDVLGSQGQVAMGVRQYLATGTNLEAGIQYALENSNRTPEQQTARLGLTITQALLRGFGPSVNLAAVRQADVEQQASIYVLRGYTEAVLAETEIAYWHYVFARREIAIYEKGLLVAEKERNETIERIRVGVLPEIEAPAAEAEVARRKQDLIDARSRSKSAFLRLKRLIHPFREQTFREEIEPTSNLTIATIPPTEDVRERVLLAEKYRPDLHEAILRKQQQDLEVVVTSNGLLPRLDIFFEVGKTGFSASFSRTIEALEENTFDAQGGIRLSAFIPGRRANAENRVARANQQKASLAIDNLRQVVGLEVRLAVNEVERAKAQIIASKATRMLQERVSTAEKERFSVGAGTTLLVAQAQRDLLAAQVAEVRAVIDYRAALVQLYRAEGTLLARRGITVKAS